jgi:Ca2+-transporting ATPase
MMPEAGFRPDDPTMAATPTQALPVQDATNPGPDTTAWHSLAAPSVAGALAVEVSAGLSNAEAKRRLAQYGPNRFSAGPTESRWRAFMRQYEDVMQIVLVIAGIGSIYPVKELGTGLVLLGLTLFNAVLGLHQEGKAAEAVAALQKMMIVKARVLRDGALTQVPAEELVPGDVVSVEAGDVVPADGRLTRVATLEVAEAALTGESLPVSKLTDAVTDPETPLGDRTDMVFMNTNVTRGAGDFIVTATGMATQVGHISHLLQSEAESASPLTKQLGKLTNQILVLAGAALVVSIVLNLSRGHEFKAVFTAAIAFAVAAIPTGLPAVVTAILSYGTQLLAQANAIVKRLRSAETLGCVSSINSDKTGTLTLNQMTAVEMTIPGRRYAISGSGYSIEGHIKRVAGESDIALDQFLQPMILASDAVIDNSGNMIGDPTEGALVVLAEKGGLDAASTREALPRVAELPFDAAYKLMATFHRMKDEDGRDVVRCFVKGAPDQLLARAGSVLDSDTHLVTADEQFAGRYMEENERLGKQGLRVMATARKDFDPSQFDPSSDLLPLVDDDLTLLALVGIVDPARPEAKDAIAIAKAAGVRVRMITGDHAVTAQAIADQLGIEGRAITGAEFGAISDDDLPAAIDDIGVIARVTPEHKVRLVKTLQGKNEIVAMTGDGVNDAPALKAADIGIAMGITGTEVSKEAAVMILTDDNFATIVKAVELGRGLYDNLVRYIRFQMGVLGGFIITFLGASIFNIVGGVPFVPLQTLWVNFTTQVFQSIGLGYGKFGDGLMEHEPRGIDEPILDRDLMKWLALVGLVHGAVVLGVAQWASSQHGDTIARTMAVTTFGLMNLFYSFTCRHDLRSVFSLDTFNDRRFTYLSIASFVAIVFGAQMDVLNRLLDTKPLDHTEWIICIVSAASILVVSEIRKAVLRRGAM